MRKATAKGLSWLLFAAGLTLAGIGTYDYYSAHEAQRNAARNWHPDTTASGSTPDTSAEEPVPKTLPESKRKPARPMPYFDPYHAGDTVAKLRLPRLATTLFVVEGTDQADLRKGPGHMPGTALPGVNGNCVIAGHRDTHFRALEGIQKGDQVELETKYGHFRYQVKSMEIVSPTDVSSLYPTDHAVLHLITCYPFRYVGHAPKRMVVEASLER